MNLPVAGPSGKTGKQDDEDKKNERKQAQEAKKMLQENVKIATLGAKCLGPLTQAETSLTKVIAKGDTVPEAEQGALNLCKTSLVTVKEWLQAAKGAVSLQDQNKAAGADAQQRLIALPCDAADLKVLLKQVGEAQKSLRGSFPKPKAKAAKKATEGDEAVRPAKRRRAKAPE